MASEGDATVQGDSSGTVGVGVGGKEEHHQCGLRQDWVGHIFVSVDKTGGNFHINVSLGYSVRMALKDTPGSHVA